MVSLPRRIGIVAFAGLLPVGAASLLIYADRGPVCQVTGNPRDPKTPEECANDIAKHRALSVERRAARKARDYWFEQIEAGHATFAEAACSYEGLGLWNEETEHCDPRVPAIASLSTRAADTRDHDRLKLSKSGFIASSNRWVE